jgi:predicted CXXCH cytochrome family protein
MQPPKEELSLAAQLEMALCAGSSRQRKLLPAELEAPMGRAMKCRIVSVGKRRDGGTRYWCLAHKADATAKYGVAATYCRYAHQPPIRQEEVLTLDVNRYPGGVALWGAVPPVYDTTRQPLERGIHVHARSVIGGAKAIDATYRSVRLRGGSSASLDGGAVVSELDAIYFMVTSVFGYDVKYLQCPHCGYAHLDKDWFSVHAHRRHLCSGCGKTFPDTDIAIGNPIARVRDAFGVRARLKSAKRKLRICQSDFPGGIQVWGSNPAIVWTGARHEEEGIHVHAFKDDGGVAVPDDTFSEVVIDGISLNPLIVRTLMAQSALPHIAGRVLYAECPQCHVAHFSSGESAFTPSAVHVCARCNSEFRCGGRFRKTILNPLVGTVERLAAYAIRRPQTHSLGLLPETL